MPLFVQGYLIMMEGEKEAVRSQMVSHLKDLMADSELYGFDKVPCGATQSVGTKLGELGLSGRKAPCLACAHLAPGHHFHHPSSSYLTPAPSEAAALGELWLQCTSEAWLQVLPDL